MQIQSKNPQNENFKNVIIVILQIVLFVGLYEICWIAISSKLCIKNNIGWGIFIHHVFIVYIAIVILIGFFCLFNKNRNLITFVFSLVIAMLILTQFKILPNRTLFLILISTTSLWIPIILFNCINYFKKRNLKNPYKKNDN